MKDFLPPRAIVMAKRKSLVSNDTLLASESLSPEPTAELTALVDPSPIIEISQPASSIQSLKQIALDLAGCTRCKLCEKRKTIVFGEGSSSAELMFVGEGPGEQEDLQGRPFVGKAGQLLDRMIQAIGLQRDQVYIANVVKCRPPGNRNPEPDEIGSCSPFLHRQLDAIRPKVVVALGKFAAQTLLQTDARISALRGKFHEYRGARLMPTFHPAFLLRNPDAKREAWHDLQLVAKELNLLIPRSASQ